MSLIFGVCNTNKFPIAKQLLEQQYKGIKDLPHEKSDFLVKENVGFGFALNFNTPESLYERMPVYSAEHQLLFVAEGRIDNRADLSSALGVPLHEKLSDGHLMLQAYLKWGESTPTKLLGDWSFAAFDVKNQELFIARDHLGYTSMFYHFDKGLLAFGSSIKSLLALEHVPKKPNVSKIIHDYTLWHNESNESMYKGIYILPPTHTLKLKNGQIQLNRFWFPENVQPLCYKNKQDYAEELRGILTEAVTARLRSHKPVASMLSGGLDSSTVSFLAAEILGKQGKRLTTLSHVPLYKAELNQMNSAHRVLDESPFIDATVKSRDNIDGLMLNSVNLPPSEGINKAIASFDSFIHGAGNAYWMVDISETAQQKGFGTLLTGEFGNAGISYTGVDYQLPITHEMFINSPKRLIKTKILKPLAFKYLRSFLKKVKGYSQEHYISHSLHLRPEIIEQWGIFADMRQRGLGFMPYYANANQGMNHIIRAGRNARCLYGACLKHFYGVENRDPTADIRVLEYCLSVPNEAFFNKNGDNKQLLKRMMKNRLPDKVLFEKKKGLQSSDIVHRVLADHQNIQDELNAVCKNNLFQELIDTQRLLSDWQDLISQKNTDARFTQNLLKTLMLGCFLEKLGS